MSLLILFTATIPSCGPNLPVISSGHIGCPAGEIQTSNYDSSSDGQTWTAHCRGRTYYCISRDYQVSCKGAQTSTGQQGTSHGSASLGCQYDSQCKGNRICDQGRCVSPSGRTAPSTPPKKGASSPAGSRTRPRGPMPRPTSPAGVFERQMDLRVGDASVYASYFGLKTALGAVILSVTHGGAAHRRNLRPGDVIVSVLNTRVGTANELNYACRNLKVGQRFRISVQRKSKLYFFKMTF